MSIHLPGHLLGELVLDRSGLIRWSPDHAWEQGGQEPRLGLEFLRNPGPRSHASELPCWFENLLPERGSELRRRLCSAHGLREGQSFELLRAVGRDLLGAVEARADGEWAPSNGTAAPTAPEQNVHDAALTGVQLKFTMSMVSERLVLTARSRDRQWIVKLPGRDFPELAEVEASTMTWARAAGFDVPEHFATPFENLEGIPVGWAPSDAPVFVVRRFDRREDGSRIHQEDLCQALDVRPHHKYGDAPHAPVSFDGVLRVVRDACGDDDARELARRVGFMIASGNGDAHLKNWSLVWGERTRPTLSPCYDLVATIAWESLGWGNPQGPTLALKLGGEQRLRSIGEATLERWAERSGCPWASEEARAGILRARDAWPEIASGAPKRMVDALEAHWRSVPLLDALGPLRV